jgi:hypothetical protein
VKVKNINLDKVGACASAVCAVHCLLTGVALGLLSVMGLSFISSPWVDGAFIGTALLVGISAIRHGIKSHKSYVPALFFITGLLSIAVGHYSIFAEAAEGHKHVHGGSATFFSVFGGLSLVLFHILNLRLQKAKRCCGEGKICLHSDPAATELAG